jgi:hypothetical protein
MPNWNQALTPPQRARLAGLVGALGERRVSHSCGLSVRVLRDALAGLPVSRPARVTMLHELARRRVALVSNVGSTTAGSPPDGPPP